MQNVGRNDPCPCGSGKKYKKCCWNERVETMRDEDALDAHEMLLGVLGRREVASTSRRRAREALGEWAQRLDEEMLRELQSLRGVQDALIAHLAVDQFRGLRLCAMWARDLVHSERQGIRRALEHFASSRLVIYRTSERRVDGALELWPIEPEGVEPTFVRLTDSIDVQPDALVFGRSLYEPLSLGRHLLSFPAGVDEDAIVERALDQPSTSSMFQSLFTDWIGAWMPHVERKGFAACFGRTRRRIEYTYADRDALLESLGNLPDALPYGDRPSDEGGSAVEGDGEEAENKALAYFALRVPDSARGAFEANFVVQQLLAHVEVESIDDEPAVRAFVESHVGANLGYLTSRDERVLDNTTALIEFVEPPTTFVPGVVRVRAELEELEPTIWREFDVPLAATLAELHRALIDAFGWTDSHLHAFETSIGRFMAPDDENDESVGDETRVPVAKVLTAVGAELTWEYDFGDGWVTNVTAVAIDAAAPPRFTLHSGARACPPEDCGGPYGYQEVVEAMGQERHPRREEFIEWLGGSYDAEAFDVDRHARRLDVLN